MSHDTTRAGTFIRWVGGKQRTCAQVAADPPPFERYVEPMVGGGSVFWHLAPTRALLADANPLLTATWAAVRDTPQVLAAAYRESVTAEYAELVETVNVAMYARQVYGEEAGPHISSVYTCAAFLALNRRAFNGLWRINRAGKFNAHEDTTKRGSIGKLTVEFLLACSARLQHVDIRCAPVFDVLAQCGAGDFVYLDPPFLGQYGGYGGARWDLAQQRLLLTAAEAAVARGARVRISNTDCAELREMYAAHAIGTIETARSVSCTTGGRGKVLELLVDVRAPTVELTADAAGVVTIPANTLKAGMRIRLSANVAVVPAPEVQAPAPEVPAPVAPAPLLRMIDTPFCPAPAPVKRPHKANR